MAVMSAGMVFSEILPCCVSEVFSKIVIDTGVFVDVVPVEEPPPPPPPPQLCTMRARSMAINGANITMFIFQVIGLLFFIIVL